MHHSMILTTLPIIFITHFVSLFLSDPKSTAIALACFLHVKLRSKDSEQDNGYEQQLDVS